MSMLSLACLLITEKECKIVRFPQGKRFELAFSNKLKREIFYRVLKVLIVVKGYNVEFITKNKSDKKLYIMIK